MTIFIRPHTHAIGYLLDAALWGRLVFYSGNWLDAAFAVVFGLCFFVDLTIWLSGERWRPRWKRLNW